LVCKVFLNLSKPKTNTTKMKKLINDIQKQIDYINNQIKELEEEIEDMPHNDVRDELCVHIRLHKEANRVYRKVLHKIKFPNW